jgi:hypothetical protein
MINIDECPYGYESYAKSPWGELVPDEVSKPTLELRFNVIRDVNDLDRVVGHKLEQKWLLVRRGNPAGHEWRPVTTYDAYALKKKN